MPKRPSVALLIETSNSYARGLLEGIVDYVRAHDAWSIWLPEQRRGEPPPGWLAGWNGDGIIARIETAAIARALDQTGLPVVDVSAARPLETVPWVETDDQAIARLAFQHFLERGFRRLAFVGDARFNWSRFREQAFRELCAANQLECHVHATRSNRVGVRGGQNASREFARWLLELPKPVGLFACYDIKAQQVLDTLRQLDLAVPEQVAVLGVDNDPLLCNLCTPPLSSVAPNVRRTGYQAAELLDRMLNGEQVPPRGHLIEPLGVETRQSTDILAVEDADVAQALRWIREHARDGCDVNDLLKVVPVSRRVLESRFQKIVGRTPHQEFLRVKLERVCRLLSETELSVSEIAHRTGFPHAEYLTVAFKREYGIPPSAYRAETQGGAGAGKRRISNSAGTSSSNVGAS